MEYLAKKLTNYIYEKKIITEELVEIYQYGFQCLGVSQSLCKPPN